MNLLFHSLFHILLLLSRTAAFCIVAYTNTVTVPLQKLAFQVLMRCFWYRGQGRNGTGDRAGNTAKPYSSAGHKEESFVVFLYLSPPFCRIKKENEACTRKQELIILVKTVLRDYLGYHGTVCNGQCKQL